MSTWTAAALMAEPLSVAFLGQTVPGPAVTVEGPSGCAYWPRRSPLPSGVSSEPGASSDPPGPQSQVLMGGMSDGHRQAGKRQVSVSVPGGDSGSCLLWDPGGVLLPLGFLPVERGSCQFPKPVRAGWGNLMSYTGLASLHTHLALLGCPSRAAGGGSPLGLVTSAAVGFGGSASLLGGTVTAC